MKLSLSVDVVAHGPIDGRHVIVLPDEHEPEVMEDLHKAISQHFIDVWRAMNPGEDIDAAAVVPLIVFGDVKIHPREEVTDE